MAKISKAKNDQFINYNVINVSLIPPIDAL